MGTEEALPKKPTRSGRPGHEDREGSGVSDLVYTRKRITRGSPEVHRPGVVLEVLFMIRLNLNLVSILSVLTLRSLPFRCPRVDDSIFTFHASVGASEPEEGRER